MQKYPPLEEWESELTRRFPGLSKPQVIGLALWSFGMVLAKSCGLSAVITMLAPLLVVKENSLRQRLREWYYEAEAKKGVQRTALVVSGCFPFLLDWVLSLWNGTQFALALDATSLGSRFVVLVVSVVYRGCAIPVAWSILKAGDPGAWNPVWRQMLKQLKARIPKRMTVLVLTDRGLFSQGLFRAIRRVKWHPFMRIKRGGTFLPATGRTFKPLKSLVPHPGTSWKGTGKAFKTKPLSCTLLALWEEGRDAPWLIVTDLPPEASDACWYGLRVWIEQGFKITKRGGWQWHRTRMTDPERAERLWLAVAVATLWLLSVGGQAEDSIPESTFLDVTAALQQRKRQRKATQLRLVSIFRRGWCTILVTMFRQAPLPLGVFAPEPWPQPPAFEEEEGPPMQPYRKEAKKTYP